ncbi:MAG TPA: hypothetical protein VFR64_19745 [Methylomirabilota bacterium]|nr:hypothetical protein [Methylomirabilota bacterium]
MSTPTQPLFWARARSSGFWASAVVAWVTHLSSRPLSIRPRIKAL